MEEDSSIKELLVQVLNKLNEPKKRKAHSPIRLAKISRPNTPQIPNQRIDPSVDISAIEPSGSSNEENHIEGREEEVTSDNTDDSDNELETLEKIIANDEVTSKDSPNEDQASLTTLGAQPCPNWSPQEPIMEWYLNAAEIELKKPDIEDIENKFKTSSELEEHFQPPPFPPALWELAAKNQHDLIKLKSLQKVQNKIYLAIKPLLDLIPNVDREDKAKLTTSIQLLSSANLSLNRFRRTTLAPHLKPEMRKQILSLPVKHNSMFGEDFNKTTDNLIKDQAVIDKIVNKSKNNFKNFKNKYKNNTPEPNAEHASTSHDSKKPRPPFRGGGRPPFRPRGKPPHRRRD